MPEEKDWIAQVQLPNVEGLLQLNRRERKWVAVGDVPTSTLFAFNGATELYQYSPADGAWGHVLAQELAREFGGKVLKVSDPPEGEVKEGEVY